MRTWMRSKATLLFIVCAALLAVGGTAMALTTATSGTSGDTSGITTAVTTPTTGASGDTSGGTSGITAPAPTNDTSGSTAATLATIQSDRADYPPGATVNLTGSGWQPGEWVDIVVNDDVGQTWSHTATVAADDNGNISDTFTLPDWFVATYKVTATGDVSGTATHTFTDAISTTTTLTRPAPTQADPTPSPNPSNIGQNVKFNTTVTCNPKNAGDQCDFTDTSVDLVQDAGGNCNGTVLASASVTGGLGLSRQATFNYAFTSSGTKSVSACFRGGGPGASAGASQSDPLTQNVNAGAAAQLAFTQQPTNAAVDAPITPAPTVAVQDASGTTVTSSNASVTVALASGSPAGTLGGTKTVNAVNGVATFPGLSIDTVNSNYRLAASSGSLTGATSNAFNTARRATSTTVSCFPNPTNLNQTTKCTATVTDTSPDTASTPTGTVNWTRSGTGNFGGTSTTTSCTLSGSGGSATCDVNYTPTSGTSHTVTANFPQSAKHAASSGNRSLTINNLPATTLTVEPASGQTGGTTTLTATLKNKSTGALIAGSHTISFKLDNNSVGSATTINGVATLNNVSLSGFAVGTYPIDATFAGDTGTNGANGSTGSNTLTVNPSDSTSPNISVGHTSNANGWNRTGSVTVNVSASDADSGVAGAPDCKDSTTALALAAGTPGNWTASVSGEGTHSITCSVKDNANNSKSANDTVNIDTTPPTVSLGAASGTAGSNGWYKSAVTQTFSATDTLSEIDGLASQSKTSNGEGPSVTVTSDAFSDKAGNTATNSATFKIDLTDPTIMGSLNPQDPASTNWYNAATGAPTVSFQCSDKTSGSGLATGACPANYTFGNGANQNHEGTVTDQAGRSASTTNVNGINVDLIAPSKPNADFGRAPEDSVGGYFKDTVTVSYAGSTDTGGSGLKSISSNQTFNTTDTHDYSGVAEDNAGNVSAAASGAVKVDASVPDVQPGDVVDSTWRNQSLSQSFSASDTGSGLANSTDSSFTLTASAESASGTSPTVDQRTVSDKVGHSVTRKVSARIDLHDPTISASVLNQPASSGWYNKQTGGPQVHFECSDVLSGIETGACPADHTVTDEGANVPAYPGSVSDRAGNSASASAGPFKIDLAAPAAAGAPDLLASSDTGTSSTDNLTSTKAPTFEVTAEAGSTVKLYAQKVVGGNPSGSELFIGQGTVTNGKATIASNQDLAEGDYKVYAHVTDQAGNESDTSVLNITIVTVDATPPDAPGLSMDATSDTGVSNSDNKTNNDKPKFNGTAETGSTLKLYDGANTTPLTSIQVGAGGSWTFTPATALSEGNHTIKATATDAAGNASNEGQLSVVIDKTAPAIQAGQASGTAGSNLWYKSVVTQTFNATDNTGGSGVDGSASFTKQSGAAEEGSNVTIASGPVSDVAGNTNPGVSAGPFKIDLYDPTVSITNAPAEGAKVDLCSGALPSPSFTAADTLLGSGIDTKSGGFTTQPPAGTSVGAYTYTAQATDFAGRTNSATRNYSVVFDTNYADTLGAYSGIQQPINNTSTGTAKSAFKLGSTVPVKFQLRCGTTPINNAVAKLWVSKIDNKPDEAVNEAISTNSPDTGNLFRVTDTATGTYQFNLSTKSGYVNPDQSTTSFSLGTYYMYIQLNDGTKFQAAQIDFNK